MHHPDAASLVQQKIHRGIYRVFPESLRDLHDVQSFAERVVLLAHGAHHNALPPAEIANPSVGSVVD